MRKQIHFRKTDGSFETIFVTGKIDWDGYCFEIVTNGQVVTFFPTDVDHVEITIQD